MAAVRLQNELSIGRVVLSAGSTNAFEMISIGEVLFVVGGAVARFCCYMRKTVNPRFGKRCR
jgi:hypothetical protein